jgi:hypothetical protein
MLLSFVNIILMYALGGQRKTLSAEGMDILSQLPSNLEDALSRFNLNARTEIRASCSACHCLHRPLRNVITGNMDYPRSCSNHPTPSGEICGNALVVEGGRRDGDPLRPVIFYSFDDWLGSILSRPDLEAAMDDFAVNVVESASSGKPSVVTGVHDSEFLREFLGPDGRKLFLDGPAGEGRYPFIMNVDFFNAQGMSVRGESASWGLISLACLALPLSLRFKPEHMFIATIIPLPKPSAEQQDSYMEPVVEAFKTSWTRGVRYSRTALHPRGRTTRSAIVIAANDLIAARETAGFKLPKSHFYCAVCDCHGYKTLGRYDHQHWHRRTRADLHQRAQTWRNASTVAERKRLWDAHGVRWTCLWELPYWDPTRQLVIDGMHCLFENMAKYHSELLGLSYNDVLKADLPAAFHHSFAVPPKRARLTVLERKDIHRIHSLLQAPCLAADGSEDYRLYYSQLSHKFTHFHLEALKFVAESLSLQPIPTFSTAHDDFGAMSPVGRLVASPVNFKVYKAHWVRALILWVCFFLCRIFVSAYQHTATFTAQVG